MAEQTIQLARGTSQRVGVEPGTAIFVRRGAVRLRLPPLWLAETWIQEELRLDAEGRYVAACGGCVEIAALDGAEVLLVPDGQPGRWEKSAAAIRRVHHALCALRRSMR